MMINRTVEFIAYRESRIQSIHEDEILILSPIFAFQFVCEQRLPHHILIRRIAVNHDLPAECVMNAIPFTRCLTFSCKRSVSALKRSLLIEHKKDCPASTNCGLDELSQKFESGQSTDRRNAGL